jgi:hypothetical protein
MKLNVTYTGGDKDGQGDLRETSEFPMDLRGGRYVLTFRHAMRDSGPTEAAATWVPHADKATAGNASEEAG